MRKTSATALTPVILRVTNFSCLLWMQPCTESEGETMDCSKAFKLHINHGTIWAHLSSSTTCSEGGVFGNTSMCDGPHAVFSRRATLAAPKGEWPYTEETPSGAAPTSPPEGVHRHKRLMELDELSGRTTGRLGYTWPTTAYGIGGTATLALRYSIISATSAARTRPQG